MPESENRGEPRIITIDGPAGCGKSTVVRMLAQRLGALALSSGLIYRAATWWVLERGIDPADAPAVRDAVAAARFEWVEREGQLRVLVDGTDPGTALHGTRVTVAIHWIADDPKVRSALLPLLRQVLAGRLVVAEGRDLGTVVFPEAPVKVFLTASLAERARRRHAELRDRLGEDLPVAAVEAQLAARDRSDSSRDVAPLRAAPGARTVDTTNLTPEAAVEKILEGVPRAWLPREGRRDGGLATS